VDSPADALYIGLDIGGTFLKGGLVDGSGAVLTRLHEPVAQTSPDDLLRQIDGAVLSLGGSHPVRALGIGLPGIVDHETGRLSGVPNLPALAALKGMALGREIERRTGIPTVLENDANALGLAEAWRGAGRDAGSVVFLTLGTGVGGAVVLNGVLWRGKSGYAGEIGHMQLDPGGFPCGCGSRGCLETIVGIRGWIRRAEEGLRRRESSLAGRALEPATIVAAAREGDGLALDIIDETARALGQALGCILNLLNVERIVIGGGVAAAGAFLLDRVVAETRRRCWPQGFEDCAFRLASLGGDAGVVGAARVAMLRPLGVSAVPAG
jgi:glucokinase